ncbi:MAG: hypothetical protein ACYC1C_21400 [Chloroflexota bacterium]
MSLDILLPFLSMAVSLVFAFMVFRQFLRRHKPYQAVWTLGLVWYAAAASTEFLGNSGGWTVDLYRWWYLLGAFFVAAYLGMGTIYLTASRRVANVVMILLALASLFAAYRVFTAPVDVSLLPKAGEVVSGQGMPADVRIMTPFFNIFGAGALVIGAGYSSWVFWRRRLMPHRVVSNVLIAVGAFVPSLTGALARFGFSGTFFLGELLGVLVIFAGFLASIEVFEKVSLPFGGSALRLRGG